MGRNDMDVCFATIVLAPEFLPALAADYEM
jgi:hypothetical protein